MTLKEIDAARRSGPVYNRARNAAYSLTKAIQLNTIHKHRLTVLRGKVRYAIRHFNEREVAEFLALWGPAFDTTVAAALSSIYTNETETMARPAESYCLGWAA